MDYPEYKQIATLRDIYWILSYGGGGWYKAYLAPETGIGTLERWREYYRTDLYHQEAIQKGRVIPYMELQKMIQSKNMFKQRTQLCDVLIRTQPE